MKPAPKATEMLEKLGAVFAEFLKEYPTPTLDQDALLRDVDMYLEHKAEQKRPRDVLDHGFVRLVDYLGNDLSVVRAARVSYNSDWRDRQDGSGGNEDAKDEKLIGYLLRNRHTSPFESVVFTFEIKCPMFVARQWHRHRTWAYNEVSARYTELPREAYVPAAQNLTTQSASNKQARTTEEHPMAEEFVKHMQAHNEKCFNLYDDLLKWGCPRELARSVLPVSTYTRFFATVNLHNLMHFLRLRLHRHAQYEIRVYAQAIQEIISGIVPVTMRFFAEDIAE